jgi:hypothetical protein
VGKVALEALLMRQKSRSKVWMMGWDRFKAVEVCIGLHGIIGLEQGNEYARDLMFTMIRSLIRYMVTSTRP